MTVTSGAAVTVEQLRQHLAHAQAEISTLLSENRRLAADLDSALDLASQYALDARQERCVSSTATWRRPALSRAPEMSQPLELEM